MQDRTYYEIKFRNYPDIVKKKDLLVMLDNIDGRTATKLFKENYIFHFRVGRYIYIPKESIIDFLVSDAYIQFRQRVDWSRFRFSEDVDEKIRIKILMLCEQPKSRRDLMYYLDISSRKTFVRLYLKPLLESGDLRMTVPEQPSISTQKYVRAR